MLWSGRVLVDHAAGDGFGPNVGQSVQKVIVGGGQRHRLESVAVVCEKDHTPGQESRVNPRKAKMSPAVVWGPSLGGGLSFTQ